MLGKYRSFDMPVNFRTSQIHSLSNIGVCIVQIHVFLKLISSHPRVAQSVSGEVRASTTLLNLLMRARQLKNNQHGKLNQSLPTLGQRVRLWPNRWSAAIRFISPATSEYSNLRWQSLLRFVFINLNLTS